MEMTVGQVVLRLLFLGALLVVGLIWFVTLVGMEKNTLDGNSFRLLNPISYFDQTHFNDDGNRFRRLHLKTWVAAGVLSVLYFGAIESAA